jgi:hypothetical protein
LCELFSNIAVVIPESPGFSQGQAFFLNGYLRIGISQIVAAGVTTVRCILSISNQQFGPSLAPLR